MDEPSMQPPDILQALLQQGQSAYRRGDLLRAIALYRQGLAEFPDVSAELRSIAHDNLGRALADTGDFDAALLAYEAALAIEPGDVARATILGNQAVAARALGRVAKADDCDDRALLLVRRHGNDPEALAARLDTLAQRFASGGRFDKAIALNAEAAALLQGRSPRSLAMNAVIRAELRNRQGREAEASEAFGQAEDHARAFVLSKVPAALYRAGYDRQRVVALPRDHPVWRHYAQSFSLRQKGQVQAALEAMEQVCVAANQLGDLGLALRSRLEMANVWFGSDLGRAAAIAEEVLGQAQSAYLAGLECGALTTLASASQSGAERRADELLLLIRADHLRDLQRGFVEATIDDPIERLLAINDDGTIDNQLGNLARDRGALTVAAGHLERAAERAKVLRMSGREANRLAGVGELRRRLGKDATPVLARLRELVARNDLAPRDRVAALRELAAASGTDPRAAQGRLSGAAEAIEAGRTGLPVAQRASFTRDFSGVYWELARRHRELGEDALAFDALQLAKGRGILDRRGMSPPTSAEVRALLGGNDALVDLTIEPDALVAYVVTQEGAQSIRTPGDLTPLGAPDFGDTRERGATLVKLAESDPLLLAFVAAIEAAVPEEVGIHLVMHPALHNLPLHIVPINGVPWCARRRIGQLPAAALLGSPRATSTGRWFVAGDSRGDLPNARAECEQIASRYGCTARTGQDCTLAALGSALAEGPLDGVHLALHGRGNPLRGGQASLLFADGAGGTIWIDLATLSRAAWKVGLVILSGCSTGLAGPKDGVRLISVANQILEAGAGGVIASLWPVGDRAAHDAMLAFHERLQAAGSAPRDIRAALEAGRAAILAGDGGGEVRDGRGSDGTSRHAAAKKSNWASFVAIGNPDYSESPTA